MYGTNPPYFEFNAGESGANPPDDLARSHSFCSECAQHNAPLLHGILSVFLMFGREQIVPLDVAMGNPRSDQGEVSQYAKILLEKNAPGSRPGPRETFSPRRKNEEGIRPEGPREKLFPWTASVGP